MAPVFGRFFANFHTSPKFLRKILKICNCTISAIKISEISVWEVLKRKSEQHLRVHQPSGSREIRRDCAEIWCKHYKNSQKPKWCNYSIKIILLKSNMPKSKYFYCQRSASIQRRTGLGKVCKLLRRRNRLNTYSTTENRSLYPKHVHLHEND